MASPICLGTTRGIIMKQPDYEFYHKLKGQVENRIEDLKDDRLKNMSIKHLNKIEPRLDRIIQAVVNSAIEDLHYIVDYLDAVEEKCRET